MTRSNPELWAHESDKHLTWNEEVSLSFTHRRRHVFAQKIRKSTGRDDKSHQTWIQKTTAFFQLSGKFWSFDVWSVNRLANAIFVLRNSLLLKEFVEPFLVAIKLNNLSMKSNISGSSESTHDSDKSKDNQFNDIEGKVTSKACLEQSSYRHLWKSRQECQKQNKTTKMSACNALRHKNTHIIESCCCVTFGMNPNTE